MQGMPSYSGLFGSGYHYAAAVGSSLASNNKAEPTHLHNVDIYIWEISYQSAIVTQKDLLTPFVTSASSHLPQTLVPRHSLNPVNHPLKTPTSIALSQQQRL